MKGGTGSKISGRASSRAGSAQLEKMSKKHGSARLVKIRLVTMSNTVCTC